MLRSNIENIANQVLSKYVVKGGAYKQFEKICAGENIAYQEIEADEKHFCGVFTKYLDEQKHIIINSKIDNEGRKNFTKAHELGHYFLGHQLKNNAFYCFDHEIIEDGLHQDNIENEANYFATCLLMPEGKVVSAFKALLKNSRHYQSLGFLFVTNSTYGIWCGIRDALTKRYGVSEEALRYRLKSLRLIDFDKYM